MKIQIGKGPRVEIVSGRKSVHVWPSLHGNTVVFGAVNGLCLNAG